MTQACSHVPQLPLKAAQPPLDLLGGVRVLDLTSSVARPYAAQMLGDMGATVIKIEKPGTGDDVRAWGSRFLNGEALWYQAVNRNKHSVTLDFLRPEGYDVLKRLVANTDEILRTWLDYDAMLIEQLRAQRAV